MEVLVFQFATGFLYSAPNAALETVSTLSKLIVCLSQFTAGTDVAGDQRKFPRSARPEGSKRRARGGGSGVVANDPF